MFFFTISDIFWHTAYLPPANEVWGKVIFLHLFVILGGLLGECLLPWGGGGVPGGDCWNAFLFMLAIILSATEHFTKPREEIGISFSLTGSSSQRTDSKISLFMILGVIPFWKGNAFLALQVFSYTINWQHCQGAVVRKTFV